MTAARHPVVTFLLVGLFVLDVASGTKYIQKYLQGGPSARGIQFVDIKLKVPPQYELLLLNRNSYFNVNKTSPLTT